MGQQERRQSRKRKKGEKQQEQSEDARNDSKSPKRKSHKRGATAKKPKSSDESSQELSNHSQNSFSKDAVDLQPDERDEFLNDEESSKGTPMPSQESDELEEQNQTDELYTVTEVPDESNQEEGSEVQFGSDHEHTVDKNQDQMMKDIGEFFNDKSKIGPSLELG